jgi:hypothetical protein
MHKIFDTYNPACQGHVPFWQLQESHSRRLDSFRTGKNTKAEQGGICLVSTPDSELTARFYGLPGPKTRRIDVGIR